MEERRARRAHGTCRWLILGLVLAFDGQVVRPTLMDDDL
jgi:hypothetical protein